MKIPRPEHPRPLLKRKDWLNLNGEWQFAFDDDEIGVEKQWYKSSQFDQTIIVPFAYQTKASGINDKTIHEVVWYSRSFEVPKEWNDRNTLLHFGAVDYASTVWVNGEEVGYNNGGHVPFSFDITPFLKDGQNIVTLQAIDRQSLEQPRGKQSVDGTPHDIDYYCTTGIWQTVWLEAAPVMRIDDIKIVPNTKNNEFHVAAILHVSLSNWRLEVEVLDDGNLVSTAAVSDYKAVLSLNIPVPNAKLWSPADPHLYTLIFKLYKGEVLHDEVLSYGGLRDFAINGDRLLLNGEPLFLAMVLDQGYWPDSGMTAPTDEAFKNDIMWTKRFGFNGSRKHQKAEDPRWLYWCDRLGLLVWGEMANAREWSHNAEEQLLGEWQRIVRRDFSHPCIIIWVPINESWGVPGLKQSKHIQYAFVERIVTATRQIDPTRPVIDNDGWEHTNIGDICAIHDYTPTAKSLKKRYENTLAHNILPEKVWFRDFSLFAYNAQYQGQPIILSEVGGYLMLPEQDQSGKLDVLYEAYASHKDTSEMLAQFKDLIEGLMALTFIAGYCYTQLTDVEHEKNGLLTYNREPKAPYKTIQSLNKSLIAHNLQAIKDKRK